MAVFLKVNGTESQEVKNPPAVWTNDKIAKMLRANRIEHFRTNDGRHGYVDELGHHIELSVNERASALYALGRPGTIVGDCLVLTQAEFDAIEAPYATLDKSDR